MAGTKNPVGENKRRFAALGEDHEQSQDEGKELAD
jgi:hypothetical protein